MTLTEGNGCARSEDAQTKPVQPDEMIVQALLEYDDLLPFVLGRLEVVRCTVGWSKNARRTAIRDLHSPIFFSERFRESGYSGSVTLRSTQVRFDGALKPKVEMSCDQIYRGVGGKHVKWGITSPIIDPNGTTERDKVEAPRWAIVKVTMEKGKAYGRENLPIAVENIETICPPTAAEMLVLANVSAYEVLEVTQEWFRQWYQREVESSRGLAEKQALLEHDKYQLRHLAVSIASACMEGDYRQLPTLLAACSENEILGTTFMYDGRVITLEELAAWKQAVGITG